VYRSPAPGGPHTLVGDDIPVAETQWLDTGVSVGDPAWYVVRDVVTDFVGRHESPGSEEVVPGPSPLVFADGFESGDTSRWSGGSR